MSEAQDKYYAGLDIGTSKVRIVVGVVDEQKKTGNKLRIIGHGEAESIGMRKGVIVHIEDMVDSIDEAKQRAESAAGVNIAQVTCNINGSHVFGQDSKGVIAISNHDREIREDDKFRAEEAATIMKLPPNQEIVQVFAKNFKVDGQSSIKDPIGMHGVRLEADTHLVVASTSGIKAVESVLDKCNLTPNHITVSALASAEACLERQQKEAGTLVINIGAGTTNLVVIEDGEVQYIGVIPVGGMHITNDLAIGLRTDLDIAEMVKLKYGSLGPVGMDAVEVEKDGRTDRFQRHEIKHIIEARIDELFELVEKELKRAGKSRKLPGGVVLTGGTAGLPGLPEFVREKLQLASRVGQTQPLAGFAKELQGNDYSNVIGLMQLDVLLSPIQNGRIDTQNSSKLLETVTSVFKSLINRTKK
jgi:cell division protein FtsA